MAGSLRNTIKALQTFLDTSLEELIVSPTSVSAQVLSLFHRVAQTVPAYKDFLQQQGIDPTQIQTLEDFVTLPLTTKDNYLRQFPLPRLCRDGKLETCDMMAVSSGSTGEPTFWPRFITDEYQIATRFEQIFADSFAADQKRTLAVVCFALGTWVGGMYTANCCRHLASKGYPLTVITPGNNKTEILRVVQALGPMFEQVVLLGYPPFLKDVIDTGLTEGVPWPQYHLKWVMAGEVFSEAWRDLIGTRVGSTNSCFDSASLYGTADAGVLGNETPLSICIRRFLANHPDIAAEVFGEARLPTLVQYDPTSRYFEVTEEGTLLFSGNNGIPLIRYHICDRGGIFPYDQMLAFLQAHGFDAITTLQQQGHAPIRPLPFVYVFGRSHFTVSFFGANIYPENVTVGLEQPEICDWVTGKFVMQVQTDADQNSHLVIYVELAPGQTASIAREHAMAQSILQQLRRLNSEFANYVPASYQTPQIHLLANGDPTYFPVGIKHRYTRSPENSRID
ncbi:phenylacetate--CoA ligase family protein [Acaryochloris marina]|uniref:phenylacetate--CoA ligase family protein n=1 Tax=Acaryochloris marina TaxID=155978 RepID=UPI001BAF4B5B|nr:phenylacetate--CoA ligase family protein [Acaryochloris marina]QUY43903.1 phenylacetate--CoA ligase family protein [Acaryochloris marina S15]